MKLEINNNSELIQNLYNRAVLEDDKKNVLVITPLIGADYWLARVNLHKDQFIQTFPKFFTFGIGFALENDWNTNLPFQCSAEEILNHIWHNHKYRKITKEQTLEAIKLLQKFCEDLKNSCNKTVMEKEQ